MPRCFVAIDLPESIKDQLVAIQPQSTSTVRLTSRDQMHLTLHFLGEISTADVMAIRTGLSNVAAPPFELTVAGVGKFPPHGPARVLWTSTLSSPPLVQLRGQIGRRLTEAIQFQPEPRPFAPHITLARLNPFTAAQYVNEFLLQHQAFELPTIQIQEFVLYSSVSVHGRSRYEALCHFPLGEN